MVNNDKCHTDIKEDENLKYPLDFPKVFTITLENVASADLANAHTPQKFPTEQITKTKMTDCYRPGNQRETTGYTEERKDGGDNAYF